MVDAEADVEVLRAEVERLRQLVGPSELAYEDLGVELRAAREAAKQAELAAGQLRGELIEVHVALGQGGQFEAMLRKLVPVRPASRRRPGSTLAFRMRRLGATAPAEAMAEQHVPRFAVLTPIHGGTRRASPPAWRRWGDQSFDDWEHVLVDDGSTDPATSDARRHRLGR